MLIIKQCMDMKSQNFVLNSVFYSIFVIVPLIILHRGRTNRALNLKVLLYHHLSFSFLRCPNHINETMTYRRVSLRNS